MHAGPAGGTLPGSPSSVGSYSLQTSNGEDEPHGGSSSSFIEQPHEQPDDESASSYAGAPDDVTPITAKVDFGLPPEFDPKQAYTWEGVTAPFDCQFRGFNLEFECLLH